MIIGNIKKKTDAKDDSSTKGDHQFSMYAKLFTKKLSFADLLITLTIEKKLNSISSTHEATYFMIKYCIKINHDNNKLCDKKIHETEIKRKM